jgi:coenzyme F420-reducing hydrogenase gamma subunit
MGITINDTYLFSLNYEDDQIVLAQDAFDLEYMMRKLKQSCSQWDLCVNFNKTEYMAVKREFPRDLLIDDLITSTPATCCKYLGVSISSDGGWNMEKNQRIRYGKRMVSCLNSIWWNQYIANKTKKRLERCLVESVMMYGSELWVKNKSKKEQVTGSQNGLPTT